MKFILQLKLKDVNVFELKCIQNDMHLNKNTQIFAFVVKYTVQFTNLPAPLHIKKASVSCLTCSIKTNKLSLRYTATEKK